MEIEGQLLRQIELHDFMDLGVVLVIGKWIGEDGLFGKVILEHVIYWQCYQESFFSGIEDLFQAATEVLRGIYAELQGEIELSDEQFERSIEKFQSVLTTWWRPKGKRKLWQAEFAATDEVCREVHPRVEPEEAHVPANAAGQVEVIVLTFDDDDAPANSESESDVDEEQAQEAILAAPATAAVHPMICQQRQLQSRHEHEESI